MQSTVEAHLPAVFKKLQSSYSGKKVSVTGGASFIGSHLVDALVDMGAIVTVVDNLSSGRAEYIAREADFILGDLRDLEFATRALKDCELIFHLAAIHGGRGFIESQEAAMTTNLAIDNHVFTSGKDAAMVVHASSACAYPINLQDSEDERGYLSEIEASLRDPSSSFPDGVYGWTKLMGEMQLNKLAGSKLGPLKGRSARIFTAYGERENESHAAVALIAKSLLAMDPFEIWGTGKQTRNFTYVADTVGGLLELGADKSTEDFLAVNVGTSQHATVDEFVKTVWDLIGWEPVAVNHDLTKPIGVGNRASDNRKFLDLFGWEPEIPLRTGIAKTLDWYEQLEGRPISVEQLESRLMSR